MWVWPMRLSSPKLPWPLVMVQKLFTSRFGSQNAGQYSIRSLKSVLQIVKTAGLCTWSYFWSFIPISHALVPTHAGDIQFPEATPSHLSFPGWECVKSSYVCLHVSMRKGKGMNVCVTRAMHETWQAWYCHFHPVMAISYLLEVVTQWRDFLNYLFSDILQPLGEQVHSQRS